MKTIPKAIIDLFHVSTALFLGATSWAAIFPGLEASLGFTGGLFLMIIINIILDLTPLGLGSEVSAKIAEGISFKKLWPAALLACSLHTGSAALTFFGADISARYIISQEQLDEESDRAGDIKASRESENQRRLDEYNSYKLEEDKRRSSLVASLATSLEKAQETNSSSSWALRQGDLESEGTISETTKREVRRLSRDNDRLAKEFQKERAAILEAPYLDTPTLLSIDTDRTDRAKKTLAQLEQDQENVSLALITTDAILLLCAYAWFILIFTLPWLAGRSMILMILGFPAFLIYAFGKLIDKLVEAIEYKAEGIRTPRELRLLSEIERLSNKISGLQQAREFSKAERKDRENQFSILSTELESVKRERDLLARNLEGLNEGGDSLAKQLERVEKEREVEREALSRLESEFSKLTESLILTGRERDKYREELRENRERVEKERELRENEKRELEEREKLRESILREEREKKQREEKTQKEEEGKSYEVKRKEARRAYGIDNPISFKLSSGEERSYKSLLSFEASLRSFKKNNPPLYLELTSLYNKKLGLPSKIKKVG